MRRLEIWDGGAESALETFRRDLGSAARAAGGHPVWRLWRRRSVSLDAGRFHRLPEPRPGAPDRRLTGGRIVPVGPAVLCSTLALPPVGGQGGDGGQAWLGRGTTLRPDQVLNRALRPILGILRALGADAFYPGRDLVTVAGRPILCAAFTVEPDGVTLVHQYLAVDADFGSLPELLAAADPDGIAGVDVGVFAQSTSLAALGIGAPGAGWPDAFRESIERELECSVDVSPGEPAWWRATIPADVVCHDAFAAQYGALAGGRAVAAEASMLGLLEVSAETADGLLRDLAITGDVIAPAATIEELRSECEGVRPDARVLDRVTSRVLARPGHFLLGVRDLPALLSRLG